MVAGLASWARGPGLLLCALALRLICEVSNGTGRTAEWRGNIKPSNREVVLAVLAGQCSGGRGEHGGGALQAQQSDSGEGKQICCTWEVAPSTCVLLCVYR